MARVMHRAALRAKSNTQDEQKGSTSPLPRRKTSCRTSRKMDASRSTARSHKGSQARRLKQYGHFYCPCGAVMIGDPRTKERHFLTDDHRLWGGLKLIPPPRCGACRTSQRRPDMYSRHVQCCPGPENERELVYDYIQSKAEKKFDLKYAQGEISFEALPDYMKPDTHNKRTTATTSSTTGATAGRETIVCDDNADDVVYISSGSSSRSTPESLVFATPELSPSSTHRRSSSPFIQELPSSPLPELSPSPSPQRSIPSVHELSYLSQPKLPALALQIHEPLPSAADPLDEPIILDDDDSALGSIESLYDYGPSTLAEYTLEDYAAYFPAMQDATEGGLDARSHSDLVESRSYIVLGEYMDLGSYLTV